jgi:hypothetical protein
VRALIYVPIIHSEVDLGSMAEQVRRPFEEAFGLGEWQRRYASIEQMWDGLRQKLLGLPLDWRNTRLYQDGLPVCAMEAEIVRDLAAQGSRNYQLLAQLMELGAHLMGTESPQLLLDEYGRIRRLAQAAQRQETGAPAEELGREGEALLRDRDAFIARRIDETLGGEETGILFIGLLHRVDDLLEGMFEVRHLIHNLPFGADPWQRNKERP